MYSSGSRVTKGDSKKNKHNKNEFDSNENVKSKPHAHNKDIRNKRKNKRDSETDSEF